MRSHEDQSGTNDEIRTTNTCHVKSFRLMDNSDVVTNHRARGPAPFALPICFMVAFLHRAKARFFLWLNPIATPKRIINPAGTSPILTGAASSSSRSLLRLIGLAMLFYAAAAMQPSRRRAL